MTEADLIKIYRKNEALWELNEYPFVDSKDFEDVAIASMREAVNQMADLCAAEVKIFLNENLEVKP